MERLSGMDAFFLYAETPSQHMAVTLCAVLDPASTPGGYSYAKVRDHIAGRLHLVPPFTRKLLPMPFAVHHPVWIPATDFDLDEHVFRAALPAPGGQAELAEFVGQLASTPLDRHKPLWEMWVVEGLAEGRFALIAKLHHAAIDGVAGVEQMVNLFDLEATPADAIHPPDPPTDAASDGFAAEPSTLELAAFGLAARARSVGALGGLLARTVGSAVAVRRRRTGLDPLASDEVSGATPLVCPPTPLNGAIGARRTVAFARLPLDEIRELKAPFGATVNDVVLAVCAGALRSYLDAKGALPGEPLVAACPVNVRGGSDGAATTGNRVSAMFSHLRTDVADPVRRLEATMLAAATAKEEHGLFSPTTLAEWAEQADPTLARLLAGSYSKRDLADRHGPAINVMVSNVAGPPFPLYLAGAELERAYPMGQIMEGTGLNITLMSYRSWVDVGLMAAANLVPDVAALAELIVPAFEELSGAAAERQATPTT